MRKYYVIRARLLDSDGGVQRLVWTLKRVWFWENPVVVLQEYIDELSEVHPHLGFDLTEFKEV